MLFVDARASVDGRICYISLPQLCNQVADKLKDCCAMRSVNLLAADLSDDFGLQEKQSARPFY
jgi:hypothetical protein